MTQGSTTTTLDRRSDYVSAVAVELGDLAADERVEIIEELDDHVAALLEDRPDVDLVAELGTPRAYAAELRAAAGLDGERARSAPSPWDRGRAWLRRVDATVPDAARPYLAAARVGWWVLRGYLFAAFAAAMFSDSSWRVPFLPSFQGNWVVGGIVTVVAVVLSVRLGTARPRAVVWRAAVLVLDLVAVWCAFVVAEQFRTDPVVAYDTQYLRNCPIELSNLYAYDASGKPLQQVRLYDQNGTPFDLSTFQCNGGQYVPGPAGVNAYPWPTWTAGVDVQTSGPPSSLAPLPGATVSASPSAVPSVTPTS